jgi:hypothetical protein
VTSEWEKNFKNWSTQTLPVPIVPWGLHVIGKELQAQVHPSVAGPNPSSFGMRIKSQKNKPRHYRYWQCLKASRAFTISRKQESIKQLLGLVQWVESDKKISKENSTQTQAVPTVRWGLQVIEKELQTQVHPSTVGPNPVASQRKKNSKKNPTQTLPVPAVPRGLQVI